MPQPNDEKDLETTLSHAQAPEDCAEDAGDDRPTLAAEPIEGPMATSPEEHVPEPTEEQTPEPPEEQTAEPPEEQTAEPPEEQTAELAPTTPTEEMPQAAQVETEAVDTSLRDVTDAAGRYARGRFAQLSAFFAAHLKVVGVVCVCIIAAILAAVLLARNAAETPDADLVAADARTRLLRAAYAPEVFDAPDDLMLSSVEVTGTHKEAGTPDECAVSVALEYANGSVSSIQHATLTYARRDGTWQCVEVSSPSDVAYSATSGIADAQLKDGVSEILSKAETSYSAQSSSVASDLSLPTIYRDAEVVVDDRVFDAGAQTFHARLRLSQSAAFTAHECTVDAGFAFRQGTGTWELTEASASPGAKDLSFSPVAGTWAGSFQSQESTDAKCFGAREQELRVTIASVDGAHVSGTLTGLAHFHVAPQADIDGSEADAALEEVTFTGTKDDASSGISFVCTTPEDPRGTVTLRLDFGAPDDPNAAFATLTTAYAYEDLFFIIPYQREVRFSDTYVLSRQ